MLVLVVCLVKRIQAFAEAVGFFTGVLHGTSWLLKRGEACCQGRRRKISSGSDQATGFFSLVRWSVRFGNRWASGSHRKSRRQPVPKYCPTRSDRGRRRNWRGRSLRAFHGRSCGRIPQARPQCSRSSATTRWGRNTPPPSLTLNCACWLPEENMAIKAVPLRQWPISSALACQCGSRQQLSRRVRR